MTNSSNNSDNSDQSDHSDLESFRTEPELILGVDGRPWGSRAILSRASGDDLDGVIDSFEVSDDTGLWDRLKDLIVRVEEAYGRVPIAVRVAALPDRSHSYELEKLRRHLVDGSTVETVPVDEAYTRRPRANDSAAIKLKSEKVSAMLAVGVARLRAPGDTLEIGDEQLAGLAESSTFEPSLDLRNEPSPELDLETAAVVSKPVLVAVAASVMAVLAVTGILGYRSSRDSAPVASATTVVVEVEETLVPPTSAAPTTAPPTTAPPTTTVVPESDAPVNGGAIDLGFLSDLPVDDAAESDAPVNGGAIDLGFLSDLPVDDAAESDAPVNGGAIDLGFLSDLPVDDAAESDAPVNGGAIDLGFLSDLPVDDAAESENGAPIDLGFVDDKPKPGSIDLSFLPPAE